MESPYLREVAPPPRHEPTTWPFLIVGGLFAGAAGWAWADLNFIPAIGLSLAAWGLIEIRLWLRRNE